MSSKRSDLSLRRKVLSSFGECTWKLEKVQKCFLPCKVYEFILVFMKLLLNKLITFPIAWWFSFVSLTPCYATLCSGLGYRLFLNDSRAVNTSFVKLTAHRFLMRLCDSLKCSFHSVVAQKSLCLSPSVRFDQRSTQSDHYRLLPQVHEPTPVWTLLLATMLSSEILSAPSRRENKTPLWIFSKSKEMLLQLHNY